MSLTKVTYSMIKGAIVNVLDFGAVGDGTTDDTTAIQAAIDNCYSLGGGEVWLPAGYYKTTASINMKKGVLLTGPKVLYGAGSDYPSPSNPDHTKLGLAWIVPTIGVTTAAVLFDFTITPRESRPFGSGMHYVSINADAMTSGDAVHVIPCPSGEGLFNGGSSNIKGFEGCTFLNAARHNLYVEGIGSRRIYIEYIDECRFGFAGTYNAYFQQVYDLTLRNTFMFEATSDGLRLENCASCRIFNCDSFNNDGNSVTDVDCIDMSYIQVFFDNAGKNGLEFISTSSGTLNRKTHIIRSRWNGCSGIADNTYNSITFGEFGGNSVYGVTFSDCRIGLTSPTGNKGTYAVYQSAYGLFGGNVYIGCYFGGTDTYNIFNSIAQSNSRFSGSTQQDGNELASSPYTYAAWTGAQSVSVLQGVDFYKTANVAGATLNGISGGASTNAIGREAWILINDTNTSVNFSGNLKGNGGVTLAAPCSGKLIHCKCIDGTNWAASIYG